MVDSDFSKLVISGDAKAEDIIEAWQSIFFEWCDIVEDAETKYRTRLRYEITLQKKTHEIVSGWLKILVDGGYNKDIANYISQMYPQVKLDPSNTDLYLHDINVIKSEMSSLGFDIKVKEVEYAGILQAQSSQDSVTREYFLKLIFNVNRYTKANPAIVMQTNAEMFAVAIKAFVDYIAINEKMISDAGIR